VQDETRPQVAKRPGQGIFRGSGSRHDLTPA
jgi:hypothetical protein